MSRRPDYVAEHPLTLPPGIAELMNDPAHFRSSGMEVVNYDPEPEPAPEPSPWQRLKEWLAR